jgi:uncharacterized protein YukE
MSEKYFEFGTIAQAARSMEISAQGLASDYRTIKSARADLSSAWFGTGSEIQTEIAELAEGYLDALNSIAHTESANLSKASEVFEAADEGAAQWLKLENPLTKNASSGK